MFVPISQIQGQWAYRIPFALQWIWPIPIFILVTLAPESPWYLVRQNRLEEAQKSVTRLARKDVAINPANTVAMMIRTNQFEMDNNVGSTYWDCLKGVDLRRTEIVCMAWWVHCSSHHCPQTDFRSSQILAGSSFANQPTYFFQQAGLSNTASFQLGLGVTALAFVGTCLSWLVLTVS